VTRELPDDRPTVAFLMGTYLGFTETFLYNQMRSLSRYRALVCCCGVDNEARYPWSGPRAVSHRHPPRLVRAFGPLHRYARLNPIWKYAIVRERATVLHAQYGVHGLLGAVYKAQLGLPLITSFYGYDVGFLLEPRKHLRHHGYYALGKRTLFAATDLVLALSKAMARDLAQLGCPEDKLRVHPNGVDLRRFRPREPRPDQGAVTVVMCGRQDEKKGFAYGFRAIRRARELGADVRVRWLVAPGPYEAQLAAEITRLGLDPYVDKLDPSEDPAEIMAACDLILAPSVTADNGDKEGVPTVLVEAAATGLPAVASRHAGIPEIVHDGESGLLFPERDVEGLASGLVRLAADRALRLRMGQAARQLAERTYDAAKLATTLEGYYDALRGR
jgi:glycosyltransferase involved in cell wall biosynthesis